MRDTSFTALAIRQLRLHRWCGDSFPLNGWPGGNMALAQYALEKRQRKKIMRTGKVYVRCLCDKGFLKEIFGVAFGNNLMNHIPCL